MGVEMLFGLKDQRGSLILLKTEPSMSGIWVIILIKVEIVFINFQHFHQYVNVLSKYTVKLD